MQVTQQQVIEWLAKVRLRGSSYNSFLVLNEQQRGTIAAAIVPEINRAIEIEAARVETEQ